MVLRVAGFFPGHRATMNYQPAMGYAPTRPAVPVKKGHGKLIAMALGAVVLVVVIAVAFKKLSSKSTPSASDMDAVNAQTSGTAQVSASASGTSTSTASSGAGPAPITAGPSVAVVSSSTPNVTAVSSQPVATSATSVAAPTVSPSAPTSSPLFVAYKNMGTPGPTNSGLCVDAGGPFNSAALYWCWNGPPQQWSVDPGSGNVKVSSTGNCLATDAGGASGASVTTRTCDSSDAGQLWDRVSGAFRLRGTQQCADSTTLANGARMTMQPCNTSPSQTWTSA